MLDIVIPICMALMGLAMVLNVARLVRGPSMPDRVPVSYTHLTLPTKA